MNHGILEEHKVHVSPANHIVVLLHVLGQLLRKGVQRRDPFIHLGSLEVCVFGFLTSRFGRLAKEVHKVRLGWQRGFTAELLLNDCHHCLVKPVPVFTVYKAISNHSAALMVPQSKHMLCTTSLISLHMKHALPDARKVTQVEDIVELGWSGQHLDLLERSSTDT